MSAKLITHSGEKFVSVVGLTARAEALVESRREDWRWHGFIDGGLDRPPPLAGVRDPAGELREFGILDQGGCGQV